MNDSLSFGMLAGEVSEEGRTDVTSCCYLSHRGSPIYFLPGPMCGGSVCRRLASILSEAYFLLSAWGFHSLGRPDVPRVQSQAGWMELGPLGHTS